MDYIYREPLFKTLGKTMLGANTGYHILYKQIIWHDNTKKASSHRNNTIFRSFFLAIFFLLFLIILPLSPSLASTQETPLSKHGRLSVKNTSIVDSSGIPFQLRGLSTHGLSWFPQYVNLESFRTLRDDWNINAIRLALYPYEYGGYCNGGDQEALYNLVKAGVKNAYELGMYAVVDWHVLNEHSPNVYKDEAARFFDKTSNEFSSYGNVLYEICNEPNSGSDWADITTYANTIIPVIRKNDRDAIIIVGTPTWSQDIECALQNPLPYVNLLYSVHFYAGTHGSELRERVRKCVEAGLPIIFSEFNICDASGSGKLNYNEGETWIEFAKEYNLSLFCWSLTNKAESASVIRPDCVKKSGWAEMDLSESGIWIRRKFKEMG